MITKVKDVIGYYWDSPSAEEESRSLLSALWVAIWFVLLNLAVGAAMAIAMTVFYTESEFDFLLVRRGAGITMISAVQAALVIFLIFRLPILATGTFDSPRRANYLDQIVSTGISPLRFVGGKLLVSLSYVLTIVASTLPFVIMFAFFDLSSIAEPMINYMQILLFSVFVLIGTMALTVFMPDWLAAIIMIVVLGFSAFLEFFPIPCNFVPLTPFRTIIAPHATEYLSLFPFQEQPAALYANFHFFGLTLSNTVVRPIIWTILSLIGLGYVFVGPRHFLERGLNNFDAVVLPGDSGRAMFLRTRRLLTRKVQFSFFYENNPEWIKHYELPIRAFLRWAFFSLIIVLNFGALFSLIGYGNTTSLRNYQLHSFEALLISCWVVPIAIHSYFTIRVRPDFRSYFRPKGANTYFDVLIFDMLVLLGLAATTLACLNFGVLKDFQFFELSAANSRSFGSAMGFLKFNTELLAIIMLYAAVVQLVSKLMGLSSLSRMLVFVFVVLFNIVSLAGPFLFGLLVMSVANEGGSQGETAFVYELIASVGQLSPIGRILLLDSSNTTPPFGDSWISVYGYWIYMPVIFTVLFLFVRKRILETIVEYDELHAPRPAPEPLEQEKSESSDDVVVTGDSATAKDAETKDSEIKVVEAAAESEVEAGIAEPPATIDKTTAAAIAGAETIAMPTQGHDTTEQETTQQETGDLEDDAHQAAAEPDSVPDETESNDAEKEGGE